MESLISVVIPIYNTEKFLERCIKSVMSQTYKNIEIILVDDGSTDNSREICERFALLDNRITVYHKVNGGLSDARNFGVEHTKGEYITFVDSDDFIAPNYVSYLYTILFDNNADISCCCMIETTENDVEYGVCEQMSKELVLSGEKACEYLLGDLYLVMVTACGKLYKKDIVIRNPFPVGKRHEDEATTCKYYYNSKRVVVGNERLYAYYQNINSITHIKWTEINEDAVWALTHRAEYFKEKGEKKLEKRSWNKLFYFCLQDSLKHKGRCDALLKSIKKKKLPFVSKVKLKRYLLSPHIYRICSRTYKKINRKRY